MCATYRCVCMCAFCRETDGCSDMRGLGALAGCAGHAAHLLAQPKATTSGCTTLRFASLTLTAWASPAATAAAVPLLQGVHNQWSHPTEFQPERFMPGGEYDQFDEVVRPYMFLPFIQVRHVGARRGGGEQRGVCQLCVDEGVGVLPSFTLIQVRRRETCDGLPLAPPCSPPLAVFWCGCLPSTVWNLSCMQ